MRTCVDVRCKMLSILVVAFVVLGLSFAASFVVPDAYAADGGPASLVAVQDDDAPEPFAITTDALPDAVLGVPYAYQLEAGGKGAESATWEKVSGEAWLTVSADGTLSGTNTSESSSSDASITVKAMNSDGDSQEKTLTIRSLYKYRQFNGNSKDDTVYASVTKEGKFLVSDGDNPGVLLNYIPIKLADVAKVDLDDYGMGDYKFASDHTADFAYDISYMQLMLYVHENYCADKIEDGFALGDWSSPGSLWIYKFWGIEGAYFTYGMNGQILIDEYGYMPTADTVALKNGDDCAMHFYADSSWYGDSNTADHYFIKDGAVQHDAEAFTGVQSEFSLVKVYSSIMDYDMWTMQSNREAADGYPFAYGKAYGEAVGTGVTDTNGIAKVTFPEAGTWYLWADGIEGAENPGKIVSAPAMVTVVVADKAAPAATVEAGKTYQVGGMSYKVTKVASGNASGTVSFAKAKNAKSVTVPATVKLADGKVYIVNIISTKAFANLKKLTKATIGANVKKIEKSAFYKTPKLKMLIVKSKLLKIKSSVKGALKGSKAKSLKVKVPKKLKKAYKKSFKKSNLKAPKKVTVK